jgi:hypothetical protein
MKKVFRSLGKLGGLLMLAGLLVGCTNLLAHPAPGYTPTTVLNIASTETPFYSTSVCADSGPQGTDLPTQANDVFVGLEIRTQAIPENVGGGFERCATTYFRYAAVLIFDFTRGHPVFTHAQLRYTLLYDGSHPAPSGRISCAAALELATQDLTTQNFNAQSAESYLSLPSGVMSRLSGDQQVQLDVSKAQWTIDVTDVLRAWTSKQRPNYGFVLVGPESSNQPCLSTYAGFELLFS